MNYAETPNPRPHVAVTEVGTRDGFQSEAAFIPTEEKAGVIDAMIAAGLTHIEATSFVSPRAVPQLADAQAMLEKVRRRADAHIAALVPNARGAERALAAGVDEMVCFVSASETHNRANLNAPIAESLANVAEVASIANGRAPLRGAIACAFGCPFEGEVPPAKVAEVAKMLDDIGVDDVDLADTIGVGTPLKAQRAVAAAAELVPLEKLSVHFHDTYGQALANILACLELGVKGVDSAVAGLGGCPYAPGATGNVATEDVVYMLHGMGIETGVDFDKLLAASAFISEFLGRPPASRVANAIQKRKRAA